MATELLQIEIQANLQRALNNLKQLQAELGKTGKAAEGVGQKSMPKLAGGVQGANVALVNFGRVVQDAPFGLIGVANNIDPLLSSFQQLKQQTGSSGAAFKALAGALAGPAGLAIAVSAATSAFIAFGPQIKNFITGTKEASKSQEEAAEAIAGSYTQVLLLKTAFEQAQGSLNERKEILSQLSGISERYFGNLRAEKTSIENLKVAYDGYINNLLRSFAVKQLEADLEPLIKRLAVAQNTINRLGPDIRALGLENVDLRSLTEAQRQAFASSGLTKYNAALNEARQLWDQINELIQQSTFLTANTTGKQKTLVTEVKKQAIEFQDISESIKEADQGIDNIFRLYEGIQLRQERLRASGGGAGALFGLGDTTTPAEQLNRLAGDFVKVNEQAKLLQDTINGGINAGIDQFFNALANNQDPFKALIQSVQRLVAELAAAVVKSLILKAVATSLGVPGGDRAIASFGGNLGRGAIVRGDVLRLATLGI